MTGASFMGNFVLGGTTSFNPEDMKPKVTRKSSNNRQSIADWIEGIAQLGIVISLLTITFSLAYSFNCISFTEVLPAIIGSIAFLVTFICMLGFSYVVRASIVYLQRQEIEKQ